MAALQALYYPGGKSRHRNKILHHILPMLEGANEYREPFVGSGVIGLAVMARCPGLSYWLNDRDPAVTCLWWGLRHRGLELIKLIETFEPRAEAFFTFKAELDALANCPNDPTEIVRVGFMKLALHRTSQSGFGSGVRGGKQEFATKIADRWKRDGVRTTALAIANRLQRCKVKITGYDWRKLIDDAQGKIFFYLDPPYVMDNPEWQQHYYQHHFADADHSRLAEALKTLTHDWALSLGDHHRVRELYDWARIRKIGARELLITRE